MRAIIADGRAGGLIASTVLVAAAVLIPFAMFDDPAQLSSKILWPIQGALIVLPLATAFGLAQFVLRLRPTRLHVLRRLVLYGVCIIASFLAATISGFVPPTLSSGDGAARIPVLWQMNESPLRLGLIRGGNALAF